MADPRSAADCDDPDRVPSPCISVCKIDDASGLCIGCLRTLDEIAAWSVLEASEKRAVIAALPARKTRIGKCGSESNRSGTFAGAPE